MLALDRLDDGKHAILLLPRSHSGRARMSRLAAKVEDIGTLAEQLQSAFEGTLRGKKVPTVGKRIRGYVDNAHHQGPPAEFK
jgi:hypothetical protein